MALSEKKIAIAELYLINSLGIEKSLKGRGVRIQAVKEIDPTLKRPDQYAYKLWNEMEFIKYLSSRRSELLADSFNLAEKIKFLDKRFEESLGMRERRLVGKSSDDYFFYSNKDFFPDSGDAKNYYGILERVLGGEVSAKVKDDEIREQERLMEIRKQNKINNSIAKEKLEIEKNKNKENKEDNSDNLAIARQKYKI